MGKRIKPDVAAARGGWHRWVSTCAVLLVGAATAWAQPVPDRDTLLLAQFDRLGDADYALGTPSVMGRMRATGATGGRFGGGADLFVSDKLTLVGDDGNFNAPQGTIEFWIKPHWAGNDPDTHRILTCPLGERKHLTVNSLPGGQLGIAIAAGEGDGWKWRRADADISAWQPDSWHHVAFVWGGGQIRVYADGTEGRRAVSDAVMPEAPPERIDILGSDAVIDALRISKRIYSADDVRRAIDEADHPPYRYLSELEWTPREAVTIGKRTLLGDVGIPLILGDVHSPQAVACRPDATALLPEPYGTLVGRVGVSALSRPGAAVAFEVWGDGKKLFESGPRTAEEPPLEIRVPIAGVKKLSLSAASGAGGSASGLGVRVGAVVRADADVVPLFAGRTIKPAEIAMYRRQEGADDYTFEPKPAPKGPFFVAAKYWEDEIDPAVPPSGEDVGRPLSGFATPGEYEPVNLVVYAVDDLGDVAVEMGDLRLHQHGSVIPRAAFDVRVVLRRLMRDLYTLPPERSTVISRFLLPCQKLDIPAGTLREYHVIVHVPEDAAPGPYTGTVRITPANRPPQELPITFEVLPFRLRPPTDKLYGIYYRFPPPDEDWSHVEVELADIREHGCTTLKSDLGVAYQLVDGRVTPSYETLERGLALLRKHDFHGPLPVSTGCEHAARLLEYDPVADYADQAARDRFFGVVKQAMEGLVKLSAKYPEFELLPTHMDEVFGRERLDRYIRLTEAVRQVPSLRVYITMHNDPKRDVSEMMRECDPFVDVRCYNGHAMDNWIRAGNSFDDLRRELERAGDEAWIYHNIRGAFYKAEWTRLVNGFYLWISPLRAHVPWMYYSFKGNPFDATDGPREKGGDFAYAVPDPQDPTRMIPTRHWEAFREGVDDMRYLETLEGLLEDPKHAGTPEAKAARTWLANLRRGVAPTTEELEPIEEESPVLVFLARKLDGPLYRDIRRQAAEHIERLMGLGTRGER